jgi:hypothetical protein
MDRTAIEEPRRYLGTKTETRPTAFAQSRHIAVIHAQLRKSPFDRDCVVRLGGLELPTNY